jgi:hypothetical protein
MTPADAAVHSAADPPPATPPPPQTPPDVVASHADALIATMDELGALLRREAASARIRDFGALKGLSESKTRLARLYDESVRRLRMDAGAYGALDPGRRERLKDSTMRFGAAVQENQAMLRAALRASQMVVNTMVSTINKERAEESGYALRGGMPVAAAYSRRGATVPPAAFSTRC